MKSIDVWWKPFTKKPVYVRRFYTRDCGCGLYTRVSPTGGYIQHLDGEQFHVKDSHAMMRKLRRVYAPRVLRTVRGSARGWELIDGREP